MPSTLYYIHDPMCAWCYAFRASLAELKRQLPEHIAFHTLLGGLAPDNDAPMGMTMRQQIQASWRDIETVCPDIHFNFDFWTKNTPRRSTYQSCRAVLVAQQQGLETEMTAAIQHAYYQAAQNPSDDEVLCACAKSIGLDPKAFQHSLQSPEIEHDLQQHLTLAVEMGVISYPSLRFDLDGNLWPITVDYENPQNMLTKIQELLKYT